MLDIIVNFFLALVIIGVPSYVFYRVGMDAGIQRGVRRQLIRELTLSGIIERAEPTTKPPRFNFKRHQQADLG